MLGDLRTFLILGEKCENLLRQAHPSLPEHQLESAKKRMNSVQGENFLRNASLRRMRRC